MYIKYIKKIIVENTVIYYFGFIYYLNYWYTHYKWVNTGYTKQIHLCYYAGISKHVIFPSIYL